MANESIYGSRRPGFPQKSIDDGAYRSRIEYIGVLATLVAAAPEIGAAWGEYPGVVTLVTDEPIETTNRGILTVEVVAKLGGEGFDIGEGVLDSTTTEIDWVTVQRPLHEHRKFAQGGDFELTEEDLEQIEKWKQMPKPSYKADFIFVIGDLDKWKGGSEGTSTLSVNAQMYAKGILKDVEHFNFYAPVARKTETYRGGPGPTSTAGEKEEPTGFDNLPEGYEWVRSADRHLRAAGQTRWQRDIEWSGSHRVLVDSKEIYWT